MAKASDNAFPSLLITEGTEPSAPAAGKQRLYIDSTTHKLKRTDSSGVDVTIESAAAATDGWVDATADTWTYATADSPTYTFTISGDRTATLTPGKRIKLTQTTAKYFIVTASVFSAGTTTVTVYGGTDYTLANAAISANYHSGMKAPDGFPLDPAKWTVETLDTTQRSQTTAISSTWYNLGSIQIVVPIGCWLVYYEVVVENDRASSSSGQIALCTLSTANNSETDKRFTAYAFTADSAATGKGTSTSVHRERTLTLAAKSTRFLNAMTLTSSGAVGDALYFQNALCTCVIGAVCAYL